MLKKMIFGSLLGAALIILTGCTDSSDATDGKCGEGKCDTAKKVNTKCGEGKCGK